jgi:hypothetical protein
MAKTKAKWVQLDYNSSDSVNANNIYYDSTTTVKQAILNLAGGVVSSPGPQGPTGVKGPQGNTGLMGLGSTGLQGNQGVTGVIGAQGVTGIGTTGNTGLQGITGPSGGPVGPTGVQGTQGNTGVGFQGTTGVQGLTGTGTQGTTGVSGQTGLQGITGPSAGPQGATGIQGQTGVGAQGQQGTQGQQGVTGAEGLGTTGVQGPIGSQGQTGPQGSTGVQGQIGSTGVQGNQGNIGIQGNTGVAGQTGLGGPTGVQGATGLSGLNGVQVEFNPINRYNVVNTSGAEVWLVSSSTIYSGVTWNRTGTNLTLYRADHSHTTGNNVIVRNTNMDYQVAPITYIDTTSFSITTSSTDGTAGSSGAYSLGFTYEHNGSPATGGTLSAPTGDHADVQLLSMRIRTGTRSGTTYDLVVPASAINGAGSDMSTSDCYVPDFNVRAEFDGLGAVSATMVTNPSSEGYSTFEFGNLSSALSRIIVLHF